LQRPGRAGEYGGAVVIDGPRAFLQHESGAVLRLE
jgi:hypothetical protein